MRHFFENIIILIFVGNIEHFLYTIVPVASFMEVLSSSPELLAPTLPTRVGHFNYRWRSSFTSLGLGLLLGSGFVAIDWW